MEFRLLMKIPASVPEHTLTDTTGNEYLTTSSCLLQSLITKPFFHFETTTVL